MKDYLTIKEFSKLSGIGATTLRYWDDIGLFSPTKRGSDNKYRYYSPDQMITVNFINVLSNLDIQLKTIGELENRTPDLMLRFIRQQVKVLDRELRRLQENYSVIHVRELLINYGMDIIEGFYVKDGCRVSKGLSTEGASFIDIDSVTVMNQEELTYILGPSNDFKPNDSFYGAFMNFCRKAGDLNINLNFPIGAMHENVECFLEKPSQPDYFISMDPSGNGTAEGGTYLVGFEHGYYGNLKTLPERINNYAIENQLKLVGPVYSIYLLDEVSVKDPSEYLVQILVRIDKEK